MKTMNTDTVNTATKSTNTLSSNTIDTNTANTGTNTTKTTASDLSIQNLNAGWRRYIIELAGVDTKNFLLMQGSFGLQSSDSSGLLKVLKRQFLYCC